MSVESDIKKILETSFAGFKDEIIEDATNSILQLLDANDSSRKLKVGDIVIHNSSKSVGIIVKYKIGSIKILYNQQVIRYTSESELLEYWSKTNKSVDDKLEELVKNAKQQVTPR